MSYSQSEIQDLNNYSSEASENENEIEIYVKTPIQVPQAGVFTTERQEQYSFFLPKGPERDVACGMRVRETITQTPGEEPTISYEYTVKAHLPDGTKDEYAYPVDKALFDLYRQIADSGMLKTRHSVTYDTLPGLVFEFDTFPDSPWVKIDLEIPEGVTPPTDVSIRSALETYLSISERHLIVRPSDKAAGNATAKEAKDIMDRYGVLKIHRGGSK